MAKKRLLKVPEYNGLEEVRGVQVVGLPSTGSTFKRKEKFGNLESLKSVFDLFAAVSGVIDEINEKVIEIPALINRDPYGEGWLLVVSPNNLGNELKALMDFDAAVEWHKKQI